uniref:Uncharacterized protein n=1 Tax=Pristionchus pacificus TaxID=54126 RepID=A0A2A6C5H9_PRIPA|eukprot:PDM73367.1 hypothetical protein PRIPAC_40723 [Pristionchus pacificus]
MGCLLHGNTSCRQTGPYSVAVQQSIETLGTLLGEPAMSNSWNKVSIRAEKEGQWYNVNGEDQGAF